HVRYAFASVIHCYTYFFSSRRRHTRSKRDWSLDVCSSDLTRESGPAWGTIAEWNFSAPFFEARHWKNMTPSAPRARCDSELRAISPGALATLRSCQFTPEVECSIRIHGCPPARDRVRSASKAS